VLEKYFEAMPVEDEGRWCDAELQIVGADGPSGSMAWTASVCTDDGDIRTVGSILGDSRQRACGGASGGCARRRDVNGGGVSPGGGGAWPGSESAG
jgi:hypothetical protein